MTQQKKPTFGFASQPKGRPLAPCRDEYVRVFVEGTYDRATQLWEEGRRPTCLEAWMACLHAMARDNGPHKYAVSHQGEDWLAENQAADHGALGNPFWNGISNKNERENANGLDHRVLLHRVLLYTTSALPDLAAQYCRGITLDEYTDDMTRMLRAEAERPWRGDTKRRLSNLLDVAREAAKQGDHKRASGLAEAVAKHAEEEVQAAALQIACDAWLARGRVRDAHRAALRLVELLAKDCSPGSYLYLRAQVQALRCAARVRGWKEIHHRASSIIFFLGRLSTQEQEDVVSHWIRALGELEESDVAVMLAEKHRGCARGVAWHECAALADLNRLHDVLDLAYDVPDPLDKMSLLEWHAIAYYEAGDDWNAQRMVDELDAHVAQFEGDGSLARDDIHAAHMRLRSRGLPVHGPVTADLAEQSLSVDRGDTESPSDGDAS